MAESLSDPGHERDARASDVACRDRLAGFRDEFYRCLTARTDALFELTDALLCARGAVKSLVDLTLLPEHRRGHGGMYDGLNSGRINIDRLRRCLAGLAVLVHRRAGTQPYEFADEKRNAAPPPRR